MDAATRYWFAPTHDLLRKWSGTEAAESMIPVHGWHDIVADINGQGAGTALPPPPMRAVVPPPIPSDAALAHVSALSQLPQTADAAAGTTVRLGIDIGGVIIARYTAHATRCSDGVA